MIMTMPATASQKGRSLARRRSRGEARHPVPTITFSFLGLSAAMRLAVMIVPITLLWAAIAWVLR
jgi:hypothetical protein